MSSDGSAEERADAIATAFEQHRPRLVAIAYGMLGDVGEAEDVVQDAWLRWAAADTADVREPAAFLTTVVTRLAIDRLRSAQKRRETYVGPWLPEPIATELDDDPAEIIAEAESLSLALLTALERLNPVERAVFLLRDVFDLDYGDLARIVDRTPTACRQIAVRARDHAGDRDRTRPTDRTHDLDLVGAFLAAAASGDIGGLTSLLAADVVAWSDGGGRRGVARQPVVGATTVARFFASIARQGAEVDGTGRLVRANGEVGFRAEVAGAVFSLMVFEVREGQITAVRTMANPDKLTRV